MTGNQAARTAADSAELSAEAGGSGMVRVWDPFVRLFHWTLVLLFAAAYLTGDELDRPHERLGYAILALLAARVVWGFIGSEPARFRDFVFTPATIVAYARDTLAGRARRYLGHNPQGGVMGLLFLAGLLVTGGSGWLMTLGGAGHEWLEALHEVAANGMLLLIALLVAGVLFSGLARGENVVCRMTTGTKRAP